MNKKALLLVTTVALTGAVAACGPRCAGREDVAERADWIVERVSRHLDLNESQRNKLDALKSKVVAARQQVTRQHETDRQEVLALLAQTTLDRTRAESLVRAHSSAIDEMAPGIIGAVGDFYDSLTPEQQQALKEHVESRMKDHTWH